MTPKEQQIQKQQLMNLSTSGRYVEALKLAEKLCTSLPGDLELRYALAQLQSQQGQVEAAIKSYMAVCSRPSPVLMPGLERLVALCLAHGLEKLALKPAKHLADVQKKSGVAQYHYALCLLASDQLLAAQQYLERALELQPDYHPALFSLAETLLNLGEVQQAITQFQRFADLTGSPDSQTHWCLNYLSDIDEKEVFKRHRDHAADIEMRALKQAGKVSERSKPDVTGRPLRVGFCSKDLCSHSVAWFLKPILKNKAHGNWEVFCYSTGVKRDAVTQQLIALSDHWRDAAASTDTQLHELIASDEVDVLVDLVGYAGDGRLRVFAQRAAAIQVAYLGYPNTTGLQNMDYRLSDEWADPEGQTDQFYTETLARLPGGFLCFEPHQEAPPLALRPTTGPGGSGIVFGSFNVYHKISDKAFECWCALLHALPESTLVMKSRPLAEADFCERLLIRFEAQGIARSRLRLQGHVPGKVDHLALYNEIDIHLDTYPYHGTTTTCEALWQGVPTLTLAGDTHRARVGCSIMNQVGLSDWVTETESQFIAKAVSAAQDTRYLADLRAGMRKRLEASPLLSGKRLVTEMDAAFKNMLAAL